MSSKNQKVNNNKKKSFETFSKCILRDIPKDILILIIEFCDIKEIYILSYTRQYFKTFIFIRKNDIIWRSKLEYYNRCKFLSSKCNIHNWNGWHQEFWKNFTISFYFNTKKIRYQGGINSYY